MTSKIELAARGTKEAVASSRRHMEGEPQKIVRRARGADFTPLRSSADQPSRTTKMKVPTPSAFAASLRASPPAPPEQAVVLCCDEKCQIQALQRSQPGLPLGKGHIRTQTHDYYRNGTVTLFAALPSLGGQSNRSTPPRIQPHHKWLEFLRESTAKFL